MEYDVKLDANRHLPQAIMRKVMREGVTPQTLPDLLIPTIIAGKSIGMGFEEFCSAAQSVWEYLPTTPTDEKE